MQGALPSVAARVTLSAAWAPLLRGRPHQLALGSWIRRPVSFRSFRQSPCPTATAWPTHGGRQLQSGAPANLVASPSEAEKRTPVKVQNLAELRHLLRCHSSRLVVLVCGLSESCEQVQCGVKELLPALSALAARHPAALLLHMRRGASGAAGAAPAQLSAEDVLLSMGVGTAQPTILVFRKGKGRLLEQHQGSSTAQLRARLGGCLAAHSPRGQDWRLQQAAEPQPQQARDTVRRLTKLSGANSIVQLGTIEEGAPHPGA